MRPRQVRCSASANEGSTPPVVPPRKFPPRHRLWHDGALMEYQAIVCTNGEHEIHG